MHDEAEDIHEFEESKGTNRFNRARPEQEEIQVEGVDDCKLDNPPEEPTQEQNDDEGEDSDSV